MLEAVHRHLLSELDRAGRSDTVFVVAGVTFNLLVLFVNWVQASTLSLGRGSFLIFILFMVGTLVVSGACLLVLMNSRRICIRCHESLSKIYAEAGVDKYISADMGQLGDKRFVLSLIVVGGTGLLAILVPAISLLSK